MGRRRDTNVWNSLLVHPIVRRLEEICRIEKQISRASGSTKRERESYALETKLRESKAQITAAGIASLEDW